MPRVILGKRAVKAIHQAVDGLFARAKVRLLGRRYTSKQIVISSTAVAPPTATHRPDLSLPGVFRTAAAMERIKPNERLEESLTRLTEGYLDATREKAKVETVHAVQSFLAAAEAKGVETDVQTVLGGELMDLFGRVTRDVKRIVETEGTRTRNAASLDAISRAAALTRDNAPVVFFQVVNDQYLCQECRRLHLLPDGVTPRVWLLSEIENGHHHRGETNPKTGGLHPHCRCTMVRIQKGYGFKNGKVVYIGPDHDEYELQRAA